MDSVNKKNVEQLLLYGGRLLQEISELPRLDAEILLSFALGCQRLDLVRKRSVAPTQSAVQEFESYLTRRALGEPIAYITGIKEFWGLEFEVSPAVLIPRPETETLVEAVLEAAKTISEPISILDLGTGSGAIIVALAYELKKAGREFECVAVDDSEAALDIAKRNAEKHELSDQIIFLKSNWFGALSGEEGSFNLIVTNPPYIAEGDPLVSKSTKFEPRSALYAGSDGLNAFREILKELPNFLRGGGYFFSEIGFNQKIPFMSEIEKILGPAWAERFQCIKDLSGNDRVVKAVNVRT